MNRVLLLTSTFPPDRAPAAIRPGQMFRYLPEFGWKPEVVAAAGDAPEADCVYRAPAGRARIGARTAAAAARFAQRFAFPYDDRLPWVPHAIAAAGPLLEGGRTEAIYSTSPFLAAHFAALWLARRYRVPWIADFQDPISDNPARQRRWIYPYDPLLERILFGNATRLVANTDTVAAVWAARFPQWKDKIAVMWNSYDPGDKIEPAPAVHRPYRVLAHVGSVYGDRRLGPLFTAVEALIAAGELHPGALRIQLVGDVMAEALAAEGPLFERMRAAGILYYDGVRLPRTRALEETAAADYLLLVDQPVTVLQVPSKLMDYIRSGKPILAFTPPDSPVERILRRSGVAHVTVAPRATAEVTRAKVAEFLRLEPAVARPHPWFEENFNCVAQARTLAAWLDELSRREGKRQLSYA